MPSGDESAHRGTEAAGNPEIADTVEEIRFYLETYMAEQARSAYERLETLTQDAAILDPVKAAIAAAPTSSEEPEPEIAEINADDLQIELETLGVQKIEDFSVAAASEDAGNETHAEPESGKPNAAAIGNYAAPAESPAIQTNAMQTNAMQANVADAAAGDATTATGNAAQAETADGRGKSGELGALVANLESSIGDSFLDTAASDTPARHTPAADTPAAASPAHNVLAYKEAAIAASSPMAQPVPQPESTASAVPEQAIAAAAAAAASPGMFTYRPAPVRPVGAETQNAPAQASAASISRKCSAS